MSIKTTAQTISAPKRYHNEKLQETRLVQRVATPIGIPIIRPKPTIEEGAIAIFGLPANEKGIMNCSVSVKVWGFIQDLKKIKVMER